MKATIVLITPRDRPLEVFASELRESARAFVDRVDPSGARLFVMDVDQAPLLGNGVNDTRANAFGGALVLEGRYADSDPGAARELAALGDCRTYDIERRCVLDDRPAVAVGGVTPGFAMVSPVFRAPALSHAEFDAHWRDRHAPLALRHHVGMWRYDQCPVANTQTAGAAQFDGIAFLYFPRVEDFEQRLFDSEAGRDIIMADTARFLDLSRSEAVLMSETVIRSPS